MRIQMTDLAELHKKPTESSIEIAGSKVIQRVYRRDKPKQDSRLLAGYGALTLLAAIMMLLDITAGLLIFLAGTAAYQALKSRMKTAPQRGQILSEEAVEIAPYFEPVPVKK